MFSTSCGVALATNKAEVSDLATPLTCTLVCRAVFPAAFVLLPMHGGEVIPGGFVLIAEMSGAPCMSERDILAASNP